MSTLSKKDVLHVSNLAKIPLTDDEVDLFQSQLAAVVDYISELNTVDTTQVEPTHQTTGLTDVLAKDSIDESSILSVSDAVSQSSAVYNNLFAVPRLIDQQ